MLLSPQRGAVVLFFLVLPLFLAGFLSFLVPSPLHAQEEPPPLELQVSSAEGDVEIQSDTAGKWKKLELGDTVDEGDKVRTGEQSNVQLEAPGVSLTEMGADGTLEVSKLDRKSDTRGYLLEEKEVTVNEIRLKTLEGKVTNSVKSRENVETEYRVKSENAVAGVRGTNFLFGVEEDGSSIVAVLDGEVFFYQPRNPDRGRTIGANQWGRLEEGQVEPSEPRPIDTGTRQRLQKFKQEAQQKLALEPRIEGLQLGDTDVRKKIRLHYPRQRSLTLSGVARAMEEGTNIRKLTIQGDFVQRTLEFERPAPEKAWQVSATPKVPEPGTKKTLKVRLRTTDSYPTTSTPRKISIVLENPGADTEPDVPSPEDGIDTEAAIDHIQSMRRALLDRDIDGFIQSLGGSSVRLESGVKSPSELRGELEDVLPLLADLSWEFEVSRAVRDPGDTSLLRLNLESTYSADFVRPVGVSLKALSGSGSPRDARTRLIRTLNSRALETYLFETGGSGEPVLTGLSSGLPVNQDLRDEAAEILRVWEVKNTLFGLFYYYENGKPSQFASLVHTGFQNLDNNFFRHNRTDFIESVRADLDHLNNLNHGVTVNSIQFSGSSEAEVEIAWNRSARLGNTRQQWLLEHQETVLRVKRGSPFQLYRIEEAPLFGLSSARTRATLIRKGTIDDTPVSPPKMITDDLEIKTADPDQFPEFDPEDADELQDQVDTCTSGTVSSDVTSDQTWCGTVELDDEIAVQSGVTLTIAPNSTVKSPAGQNSLVINGNLRADGVTFTGMGDSKQSGTLVLNGGADVRIDNSVFEPANGSAAISIASGATVQLTSKNNEYRGRSQSADHGVWSGGTGGQLSFENDVFTDFSLWGICNAGSDGICLPSGDPDDGMDVSVTGSDFIGIGNSSSGGAIGGADGNQFENLGDGTDPDGTPLVELDGNYVAENSGNSCVTTSEWQQGNYNYPDQAGFDNDSPNRPQFFGVTEVLNAAITPNQASVNAVTPCDQLATGKTDYEGTLFSLLDATTEPLSVGR